MTVEEKIKEMLYDSGMSEKQCEEVIKRVKSCKIEEKMINRWNDSVENYPNVLIKQLWIHTKHVAFEYMDETCPEA